MKLEPFWPLLEAHISAAAGQTFIIRQRQSLSGGCINLAWKVSDHRQDYFVKTHAASGLAMFEAEAKGLAELAASRTVRVPEPVCYGNAADLAYLVLEYLPLGGDRGRAMETLGRQLALLHRQPQPYFGWQRDNAIGSTPQPNQRGEDWIEFWRERRLGFQFKLAARNGYGGVLHRRGEALPPALLRFHHQRSAPCPRRSSDHRLHQLT